MNELQLVEKSIELIQKDLGLEEEIVLNENENSFEQLHKILSRIVQYLLDKDFGQLLNSMYRIDISEHQVKQILNLSEPNEIASNLALAIIEREKQKVITRIKYSR